MSLFLFVILLWFGIFLLPSSLVAFMQGEGTMGFVLCCVGAALVTLCAAFAVTGAVHP